MISVAHTHHFENHRRMLYGIAYRMLGSFSDAEDVVQDAYLRWQDVRLRDVESPAAYLASTVSRLCIDRQRRAKIERLLYTGPWLPEPVNESISTQLADPEAGAVQAESISMAFLHLLQTLPPMERAVFILREAFDLPHDQIAGMLDINLAHSRQLLRRAKTRIDNAAVPETSDDDNLPLMERFLEAATTGNLASLQAMMADDIVAYSDGGGRVSAAIIPLRGKDRVSTVLLHILRSAPDTLTMEWASLNGQVSLVIRDGNSIHSTHTITTREGLVHRVYTVRNPDKLHYVQHG